MRHGAARRDTTRCGTARHKASKGKHTAQLTRDSTSKQEGRQAIKRAKRARRHVCCAGYRINESMRSSALALHVLRVEVHCCGDALSY
eukprot:7003508-Alexandrium_andersonii.AAC.1